MKPIRGVLTVKELRERIASLPDDMPVVTSGSDHSYNFLGKRDIEVVKAEYLEKQQILSEHYHSVDLGEHYPDGYVRRNAEIIEVLKV